ncbi:MAG: tyrosine-type recombinase/integrase [Chloroflexi bacterium]|nr:tyrosine-type recombinase/integrase [Chloroflexota bacterium]MCL5075586.1 tyrosine-type recombinase/integrase [Chloroflexota bacterium]
MTTESPAYPTITEAIQLFRQSIAGKSQKTIQTYTTALNRLQEYLNQQTPDNLHTAELPADLLEDFYLWLIKTYGRDQRFTVATYVAGVRAFVRFLSRRNLLPAGLSFEQMRDNLREVMGKSGYKTPRVDKGLPLLVVYVNNLPVPGKPPKRLEILRDKAIVNTLYSTGMRRGEVSSLNREDLDDGRSTQAIITGKGHKERVVFFDNPTLEVIRTYLAARNDRYSPLFIRHDKGRGKPKKNGTNFRLSPQSIWQTVKRYAHLAGVNVSTHDFRHTKASVMLNKGAKLSEVQDILGHASPETTKKIYAHYEISHLRQAFDRYSISATELAAEIEKGRG